MELKSVRIAAFALGLSLTFQSCTKSESAPIVESVHRLKVVDEDSKSASQPLSRVLNLNYNADQSWWTWREVLLSRLRDHQFEDIDNFADDVRAARERFPGGGWKLSSIYDDINEPSAGPDVTEEEWQTHLALFEEWIAKYPNSPTARAGYADTWVRYAWRGRGPGPAADLTPSQSRLFAERLKHAKEIAVEALSLGLHCPQLYSVLLSVGQGQGWNRKQFNEVFEAAITDEPLYRSFYHKKASYLLPQWYGREGEWQAFAAESAERLGGDDGADMLYFIYTDVASYYYGERDLPDLTRPVWNDLKAGFEARERLHGVTADQRTVFGRYAYMVGDRPVVQTVIDKLGDHWNQGLWGSLQRDQVIEWAAGKHARADLSQSAER